MLSEHSTRELHNRATPIGQHRLWGSCRRSDGLELSTPWGSETLSVSGSYSSNSIRRRLGFAGYQGLISRDRLWAAWRSDRARFDVDPADLVFARARETYLRRIER